MKKLFLVNLLVVLGFLSIHGQTSVAISGTNTDAKEERNKKIALASFSAYQAGDMEASFKDFDKEVLTVSPGRATVKVALDSLKLNSKSDHTFFTTAFPDLKNEVLSPVAEGDYVMLYFESSGTWKGKAVPYKPTGKSFKARDVAIFKFNDDGKIIEQHYVMPVSEIISQVGDGVEIELNSSGYKLMGQKKITEAIELFKFNVKLYPQSSNTYDSLAEAYEKAGNKKLAIENYEKAVKLDPDNKSAMKTIEKLKGK